MLIIETILLIFVSVQHLLFMVLEMFLWHTKIGMKVFNLTPDFAAQSKKLAANQGLYNGFLAAGILVSLVTNDVTFKFFFASCVLLAGIVGAITVGKRIFWIQGLPALFSLLTLLWNSSTNT